MHVLDNPVWHALGTFHSRHAERVGAALRYHPDVSVFAAVDTLDAPGWEAFGRLVSVHGTSVLFRVDMPEPPSGLAVAWGGEAYQMVLDDPAPLQRVRAAAADGGPTAPPVVELGPPDAPEMVALVARTEPGPFRPRTVELGDYVGVRHAGALVAMAGTRLRMTGFTEISAVCTDAAWRGRGLASLVTATVAGRIEAAGSVPMLHVASVNADAIRLYQRLGFRTRAVISYRTLVPAGG